MNSLARAFLLCASTLVTTLPAHADLSAPQMNAAGALIAAGKLPKLDLDCPSVAIPSSVIRTQADLDKMNVSLKAREACVQTIRDTTFEPNLRTLVQIKYPKASEAQVAELTGQLVVAVKPVREKVLDDLRSVQMNAINMGRPFVLRSQIQDMFLDEASKCKPPARPDEWGSVSRAKSFLTSFEPFDACLDKVIGVAGSLDEKKFVEKVLAKESDLMKGQILLDFPRIQRDIVNALREQYRNTLNDRIRAKRYIDTNGRTDQPYYKGGLVNEEDDKDE